MDWLTNLEQTQPVAWAIGLLSLVCVIGMMLGSLKFRGIGLGTSGVLFAGILIGHLGGHIEPAMLDFVKELGLTLFVFTIGLQLGPGFFAALRRQGLVLNLLALAIVALGAVTACVLGWLAGFSGPAVLGIFSGATTNTPSLGAGSQTLSLIPGMDPEQLARPALAYAVTYPTAILCIIGTLLVLKTVCRIDLRHEADMFAARNVPRSEAIERRTLVVTNPNLFGIRIADLPGRVESGVTISRIRHNQTTSVATENSVLNEADRLVVVGTARGLDHIQRVVGSRTSEELVLTDSGIAFRRVLVTDHRVPGMTIAQLQLNERFHVAVTRVTRADMEMTAIPGLQLQFGDMLQIVGNAADLDKAAAEVGNSLRELNETHFVPMFSGLVLGILLGTLPIAVPGLPQPVRLGLAGGPLIVALLMGRFGRLGRMVCHMPVSSNLAFREFGIALFFASVGLHAGPAFFGTVFSRTGISWLLTGVCVTILPLVVVGLIARFRLKLNFLDLTGLLAGSMTDPPALAFASNIAGSDAPAVAYATVYPLTTLLRILFAQILALSLT